MAYVCSKLHIKAGDSSFCDIIFQHKITYFMQMDLNFYIFFCYLNEKTVKLIVRG